MTRRQILHVLFALAALSLLAACGPADGSSPVQVGRNPFSLQTVSEDGTQVRLEAYANGYQPGASETVDISISNNTDQAWHGRLCVQLLEPAPSLTVLPLVERAIDLELGVGFDDTMSIVIPDDLSPGTYGLALVVHRPGGPAANVISIQVGESGEEMPADSWPTEAALRACPPPAGSD
ncbi:MAG: hypothetical protein GWN58_35730 [Anaerolineae bacterium]|nr:hypothetical protein [Anaerolineae bacterium]